MAFLQDKGNALPAFHPATAIRSWGGNSVFSIADAQAGVCVFGATGSGKTSGPAKHLAYGYLSSGFGGLILTAKVEERNQWVEWARDTGRLHDLMVIDKSGRGRFNFLDYEAQRAGEGGGLTISLVAMFDELAGAIAKGAGKAEGGGGDNKFFDDALHHMNTNLVDLPLFAGLPVSLPLMRAIVNSAPLSIAEVQSEEWQKNSACAAILREADEATQNASTDVRADFEECREYWQHEFPALSDRTRSIIVLSFSMLVRPFITRPLRRLFATDTTITPEAAFDSKILLIDFPVQEYRMVGRMANLIWKFCFQTAVLRRTRPLDGSYLRPVFLWADEAQNFVTDFDAEYQAVARSAGGCTVYLTQNRESYRRVLGNADAVDSLLGNLQTKFFCQNAGDTNEWAAKLMGERWISIASTNFGHSGPEGHVSSGGSLAPQRRFYVEPAHFTTLKRGGEIYQFQVSAIAYKGGAQFLTATENGEELLPYTLLTFNQR